MLSVDIDRTYRTSEKNVLRREDRLELFFDSERETVVLAIHNTMRMSGKRRDRFECTSFLLSDEEVKDLYSFLKHRKEEIKELEEAKKQKTINRVLSAISGIEKSLWQIDSTINKPKDTYRYPGC